MEENEKKYYKFFIFREPWGEILGQIWQKLLSVNVILWSIYTHFL